LDTTTRDAASPARYRRLRPGGGAGWWTSSTDTASPSNTALYPLEVWATAWASSSCSNVRPLRINLAFGARRVRLRSSCIHGAPGWDTTVRFVAFGVYPESYE
jgi:hypothetical protein